jgi:myo-inositol-1(or 4)-monophosphatase
MSDDRSKDFGLLKETAREASQLALKYWRRPLSTERKPDGTAVTEADYAVDALLAKKLRSARPDYGWLSEESADNESRLSRRNVWVVDPIDGTRAFIDGKEDWTIALALVEDGEPVLAVVINPVREEVFEAAAGGGAFLNGERIRPTDPPTLEHARILAADGVLNMPIWKEPWPALTLAKANSLAYRLALVACGRADAALALTRKSEWDIAAGALLVSEAGGVVTTADGSPLRFNSEDAKIAGFLVAGPNFHNMLVTRLSGAAETLAKKQRKRA